MSFKIFENELVKLEKRRESLQSQISVLNRTIESINEEMECERGSLQELQTKRESLIKMRNEIETRSIKIRSKISFKDLPPNDSGRSSSKLTLDENERASLKTEHAASRKFMSEQTIATASDHPQRKNRSMPTAIAAQRPSSKHLSMNIPIDILKKCDSYAFCEACNEAIQLAKKNHHEVASVHSIQPSYEYSELSSNISFSSDDELAARQSSKKLMRELLDKYPVDCEEISLTESTEVTPYSSCPSVNVCQECAQLYQVKDMSATHLPLCLSVDLCHTCACSRKATAVESKCSFATNLSEVSCFSYNDCEDCRIVREQRLQKTETHSNATAANKIPYSIQQRDQECEKSSLQTTRPITVHSSHPSSHRSTRDKHTNGSMNLARAESQESTQMQRKSLLDALKTCQSHDTCDVCSQRFSQFINETQSKSSGAETPTNRQSTLHEKLSLVMHQCESHTSCSDCAKLSLLKSITSDSASYEHPIETCPSYNTCRNCQQVINNHPIETCNSFIECRNCRKVITSASRRSSLLESSKRVSLRKSSDGKIINIVPSKTISRSSAYEADSDQLHQSRRHTNSPVCGFRHTCETNMAQSRHLPSSIQNCPSLGVCQACTDCVNELVTPTKSFVLANCTSHDDCSRCGEILRKKSSSGTRWSDSSRSSRKSSSRPSYKISKLSRKSGFSDSDDSSSAASLSKKSSPVKHSRKMRAPREIDSDSSGQVLYETFKSRIEKQNDVVSNIQTKISKMANIKSANKSLVDLRKKLDSEKNKLRDMVQVAMYEQRIRKDDDWRPIKVVLYDDLS